MSWARNAIRRLYRRHRFSSRRHRHGLS
jgi:hypothetical protein